MLFRDPNLVRLAFILLAQQLGSRQCLLMAGSFLASRIDT